MKPFNWILEKLIELFEKVKERVEDHAREFRIANLEHNKKYAEQNDMYYFHKMLIADIEAEERKRSPAQRARMAKKQARKVMHE